MCTKEIQFSESGLDAGDETVRDLCGQSHCNPNTGLGGGLDCS